MDLALNNLKRLICHKTQTTKQLVFLNTSIYCRKILFHAFRGCPRGVMVKARDCGIVVREFVL